jgi:hypothetical protein
MAAMKTSIKDALFNVVTRAFADKLGVAAEAAAPKSFGARVSMLVAISGGLMALGKALYALNASIGAQSNTIAELTEKHESLRAEFNALAGHSDDGTSELQRLRAEVRRLKEAVDVMRTGKKD